MERISEAICGSLIHYPRDFKVLCHLTREIALAWVDEVRDGRVFNKTAVVVEIVDGTQVFAVYSHDGNFLLIEIERAGRTS
jgi:hypothetical protein